ncbi:MAG: vWA domain-containing protein [Verrucomicrobiota bacterium]
MALLLLNPGRWEKEVEGVGEFWAILFDGSDSMAEENRREDAAQVLREVEKGCENGLRYWSYRGSAEELSEGWEGLEPGGEGSDFIGAVEQVLENSAARGQPLGGLLVVGDGRQTVSDEGREAVVARAKNLGIPVHVVAVGGEVERAEVKVRSKRPSVLAFASQKLKVSSIVNFDHLPPARVRVVLETSEGVELAGLELELEGDGEEEVVFEVEAPEESTVWRWRVVAGGVLAREPDADLFEVRVLEGRTRVFLAEGAPYWDSKFLAQHLRLQEGIELNSVHRLSAERWFRIDTGEEDEEFSGAEGEPVFPDGNLGRYDLVVFGKNVASFLTKARVEELNLYVREQGGAVLFSRGRAFGGRESPLESLEPVVWDAGGVEELKFRPTAEGEAVGLFGVGLPGRESGLWDQLPPLKDGNAVAEVKSFTRVLAEGEASGLSGGRVPLLLVRRYGQGVCGLVNGDGLWRWDFYPEAKEDGNLYAEFWTQLVQWMASWSEFLPGQDFSLRTSARRVQAGEEVAGWISWRGEGGMPEPRLVARAPDGREVFVTPARLEGAGERPRWRATVKLGEPGWWELEVVGVEGDLPTSGVLVERLPREEDELSADPYALERFAEATGGRRWGFEEGVELREMIFAQREEKSLEAGVFWKSLFREWWVACLLVVLLGGEWWLRRRSGLI